MLILPKGAGGRPLDDYARQNPGKRSGKNYVLVPDPVEVPQSFALVWDWLYRTAAQLTPPNETGIPFSEVKEVLFNWCRVTKVEADAWREKGANEPIFREAAWDARAAVGRDAQVRIYDNAVDLTLAIIGFIRSQRHLAIEQHLAGRVLRNERVASLVREACMQACAHVIAFESIIKHKPVDKHEKVIRTPDDFLAGEYQPMHQMASLLTWRAKIAGLPTHINIMVLHDISTRFDTKYAWTSLWTHPDKDPQVNARRGFQSKSTMRHNVGTVNEDTPWAERARFHDHPVWAGPSGTTETLCRFLAETLGLPPDHVLACAYALFALWASDHYRKTLTPIHHLFGVMTGAAEYLPPSHQRACLPLHMQTYLTEFLEKGAKRATAGPRVTGASSSSSSTGMGAGAWKMSKL
jgi:hypothetical protein